MINALHYGGNNLDINEIRMSHPTCAFMYVHVCVCAHVHDTHGGKSGHVFVDSLIERHENHGIWLATVLQGSVMLTIKKMSPRNCGMHGKSSNSTDQHGWIFVMSHRSATACLRSSNYLSWARRVRARVAPWM